MAIIFIIMAIIFKIIVIIYYNVYAVALEKGAYQLLIRSLYLFTQGT